MTLHPVRASKIERIDPTWLWRHRIPLRGVTVLQGDGGLGKGLITVWLVAQLSRGALSGSIAEPANSLIVSLEDTRELIQTRLAAAGADLDRVEIDDGSALDLLADADVLVAYMRRRRVRLLILDPLHAIVPAVSFDVRRALLKVTRLTDAAALVINHLNGSSGNARSRGLGGRALQNLSRATHILVPHPDDGESNDGLRILAPLKMNGAPRPRSIAGRIVLVGASPIWEWIAETDYTTEDLLARRRTQPRPTPQLDEAISFLRALLTNGPVPVLEVQRRAVETGLALGTLRRAREDLGVIVRRVDFGPNSHIEWALPPEDVVSEARVVPPPEPAPRPAPPPSSLRESQPPAARPQPPTPPPAAQPQASVPPPTPTDIDQDDAAKRFSLLELD